MENKQKYINAFQEYGELLPQDESEYDFSCLIHILTAIDYVPGSEEFHDHVLRYCKAFVGHFSEYEEEYDDYDPSEICYSCKRPREVKPREKTKFQLWHEKYDNLLKELK